MTTVIVLAVMFALGAFTGLCFKGINITITHKEDKPVDSGDKPVYNSSFGDPEVRQYLDQQFKVGE